MDIFLMFIFNIFTGAIIFLILSLKIEKTSATFQEQKLRREMGEIITEFNSTAERNITLLENRISVLKKMMNESGSLKGVDFTVLDDKMMDNISRDKKDNFEKITHEKPVEKEKTKTPVEKKAQPLKEEHTIMGAFMDKIQSFNLNENIEDPKGKTKKTQTIENKNEKKHEPFSIIEKSITEPYKKNNLIDFSADEEIIIPYEEEKPDDIEEMFQTTNDKYLLIAQLFNKGHSVEELSKHSGLPAGEIKLVISLNS